MSDNRENQLHDIELNKQAPDKIIKGQIRYELHWRGKYCTIHVFDKDAASRAVIMSECVNDLDEIKAEIKKDSDVKINFKGDGPGIAKARFVLLKYCNWFLDTVYMKMVIGEKVQEAAKEVELPMKVVDKNLENIDNLRERETEK